MTEQRSPRIGWRSVARAVVVLGILGFSVWYVVRNLDWSALGEAIANAEWYWVVGGVLFTALSHLMRAVRWKMLMSDGGSVPLLEAFNATILGYFMNNVIPRSGEIVRPVLLARRMKIPAAGVIASIVVERLLDGLTLLALLVGLFVIESGRFDALLSKQGYSREAVLTGIGIPVGILAVALLLIAATPLGDRFVAWLGSRAKSGFGVRVAGIVGDFRRGLRIGGAGGAAGILFWSIAIWAGYAAGLWCGVAGMGLNQLGIGPVETTVVLSVTAVGITIAPTPGAIGVFHLFCTLALVELYGIAENRAVAFALVTHAIQYLTPMLLGGIILLRQGLNLRELVRGAERAEVGERKGEGEERDSGIQS